jgi:hypothetical protein
MARKRYYRLTGYSGRREAHGTPTVDCIGRFALQKYDGWERIGDRVGKGGQGTAYRARSPQPDTADTAARCFCGAPVQPSCRAGKGFRRDRQEYCRDRQARSAAISWGN